MGLIKSKYVSKMYSPLKKRLKLFVKKIKTKHDLQKDIKNEFLKTKNLPSTKNIFYSSIFLELLEPEIFFQNSSKAHLKKIEEKIEEKISRSNISLVESKSILGFEEKISKFLINSKDKKLNFLIKREL